VINPVLAAGQIEGGVAQAIGWALYEQVVWREGRMANAQMTNTVVLISPSAESAQMITSLRPADFTFRVRERRFVPPLSRGGIP
jgi:xanthine dehydrogenase molybdopterin-binding subunit B